VSASYVGNYAADPIYGVQGTIASVIYTAAANPDLAVLHRAWAQQKYGAP
jgi:hypothetical protein